MPGLKNKSLRATGACSYWYVPFGKTGRLLLPVGLRFVSMSVDVPAIPGSGRASEPTDVVSGRSVSLPITVPVFLTAQ